MSIDQVIEEYKFALLNEHDQRDLPNHRFNSIAYYAAITSTNYWRIMMLNHKDWSIELQDKHYVQSPGSIAYPVSS